MKRRTGVRGHDPAFRWPTCRPAGKLRHVGAVQIGIPADDDRSIGMLEEFIDGEGDFEDAVALDESVLAVRRGDGKISPKDHAMPPGFGGW